MTDEKRMRWLRGAYLDLRTAGLTLILLLPIDLLIIGLHVFRDSERRQGHLSFFTRPFFAMTRELGLGESFEYGKTLICALGLAALAHRTRLSVFWLFSALFAWLTVDNAFALHEGFGRVFASRALQGGVPGFPNAKHVGEIVGFAIFGALLGLAFSITATRTPSYLRPTVFVMVACVLSMPLFGVGIDALHASSIGRLLDEPSLIVLEDGGELVSLSLNCAVVLACARYPGWTAVYPARPAAPRGSVAADA